MNAFFASFAERPVWLMAGVVAVWLGMRFIWAPKGGAPRLSALFRREPALPVAALGPEALTTLTAHLCAFAKQNPEIEGVLLVGPFAAGTADTTSAAQFYLLTQSPQAFATPQAFDSWTYPAAGHPVLRHDIEAFAHGFMHRIAVKGAPLILIFIGDPAIWAPAAPSLAASTGDNGPLSALPLALEQACLHGMRVLYDARGNATRWRQIWARKLRNTA